MKNTKEIGDGGEDAAVKFLEENGYSIIERNFRTPSGEIDVIALDGDSLVFVEVKRKTTDRFGLPGEMITPRKIQKIRRTADGYLAGKDLGEANCRIDAVLIDGDRIEIVKNIAW